MKTPQSVQPPLQPQPIKKGRYRHYKDLPYEVLGTVLHSETLETLVLYKPLYGEPCLWVRPYTMFTENVRIDGKSQPRFQFEGES